MWGGGVWDLSSTCLEEREPQALRRGLPLPSRLASAACLVPIGKGPVLI